MMASQVSVNARDAADAMAVTIWAALLAGAKFPNPIAPSRFLPAALRTTASSSDAASADPLGGIASLAGTAGRCRARRPLQRANADLPSKVPRRRRLLLVSIANSQCGASTAAAFLLVRDCGLNRALIRTAKPGRGFCSSRPSTNARKVLGSSWCQTFIKIRGSKAPFCRLHGWQASTWLRLPLPPPADNGIKWSRVAASRLCLASG